jgi:MFS family permease
MPPQADSAEPESAAARALRFLGLQRSTIGVLAMVILVGMGERMSERFLPIYLIALGGGAISIGLLNALDHLLSAVYSYVGGHLSDRLGTRRALALFNLVAMAGFLVVILFPFWQAVLAGAVLFISWSAVSLPATMGLIVRVLPAGKRIMGASMYSLVNRIPMALGPILGGLCIAAWGERDGVRVAFGAALALALVGLLLQQALIVEPRSESVATQPLSSPVALWRRMTPALRTLLVADVLVRFCEQITGAFVVVWCMKTIATPVSAVEFGVLSAVEMATAVLIYIPVAWMADRSGKKPFVLATFAIFTIFPIALMAASSFAWLVPVFVLRGLKEFGEPTRKALIVELAPDGQKAAMFGLYYLVRDGAVTVAAIAGALLWEMGPQVNFAAAFACGVLGTVWYALRGTGDPARPERG